MSCISYRTILIECFEYGYLDDTRFMENFIHTSQNKGFGSARIKRDLLRKGIDANEITNVFETTEHDYIKNAVSLLSGKYKQRIENQHLKQKAMLFLQAKGHAFDDIFSMVSIRVRI